MQAFHNSPKIKKQYLLRVKNHEKADEIIKGRYWEGGKGCAVGCTIHSADHGSYETELGIPRILARLEDGIFEGMPNEIAKTWPRRFLAAIKPGADLSNVWPKFAHWMLADEKYGVLQFARTDGEREAIQSVADLYQLQSEGMIIDLGDWQLARDAAYAAAYADAAAAYAAAYADAAAYAADAAAAAAYAADAAAAAAYAADAAAYAGAAAAAAARSAKRQEWRIAQSEKLIELLKEAK